MLRSRSKSPLLSALAALAFVLIACPGSSWAANDGFDAATLDEVTESAKQIPLTEDMVNRLIESYPEMRKAGEKFGASELPEHAPAAGSGASDLDAMAADKRVALEAVAVKYGFKDLDEWSTVASSVVMSYAYAMQGKKPGSLEEAVKANIEHAKNDPSLSAQEKQETIAQFTALATKLARLEPLQQNYDLVVKMKDKVTPIMEAR